MKNINNLGNWSAEADNSGKTPVIIVNGIFPTNGEKPLFHLRKNEPQGINDTELLLTLIFGNLADPTGNVDVSVIFSEVLVVFDYYKTVKIVDEDNKAIATIEVSTKNEEIIGKWQAELDNSGKAPFITIIGKFPTNGEKPRFHLRRNDPQGINNTELLLTLVFGNLADSSGQSEASVIYSEIVTDELKSVLIIDENGRKIASLDILAS